MAKLFGYDLNREELSRRVGNMSQVCGARESILTQAHSEGVRVVDVRTGSGFQFTVVPTRGLDIYSMEYRGIPVGWISKTGLHHPGFCEKDDFLRYFSGGVVFSCGICNAGIECEEDGQKFGVHGNLSRTPAESVVIREDWINEDTYIMEIRGRVIEAHVMGENLVLERVISTSIGARKLQLVDGIHNASFSPAAIMLLYHMNVGFPIVSEDSVIVAPVVHTSRWIDNTRQGDPAKSREFLPPTHDFPTQVFVHTLDRRADGMTGAAIVNQRLKIGFYIKYDARSMPYFSQWRMLGEQDYVIGFEPGNCIPEGRASARANGRLEFLPPRSSKVFAMEMGILEGVEEVEQFRKWLAGNTVQTSCSSTDAGRYSM